MRTGFDKYLFTKAFMEENARKDQKKRGQQRFYAPGFAECPLWLGVAPSWPLASLGHYGDYYSRALRKSANVVCNKLAPMIDRPPQKTRRQKKKTMAHQQNSASYRHSNDIN